jgi:hypothetical protein
MERTWTALWKMPPRPMRSLKMRLIWRMVLFVFSESLFVTSYTWSTTSCIAAPPPASRSYSSSAAEAAVRFGLERRERAGTGDRSVGAWGGCWLRTSLVPVARDRDTDEWAHFNKFPFLIGASCRRRGASNVSEPAAHFAAAVPERGADPGVGGVRRPRQGPERDRRTRVRGESASPAALISRAIDLMPVFKQDMYVYVGFSAATGKLASSHYIFAWSFRTGGGGVAKSIDLSSLPAPRTRCTEACSGRRATWWPSNGYRVSGRKGCASSWPRSRASGACVTGPWWSCAGGASASCVTGLRLHAQRQPGRAPVRRPRRRWRGTGASGSLGASPRGWLTCTRSASRRWCTAT